MTVAGCDLFAIVAFDFEENFHRDSIYIDSVEAQIDPVIAME